MGPVSLKLCVKSLDSLAKSGRNCIPKQRGTRGDALSRASYNCCTIVNYTRSVVNDKITAANGGVASVRSGQRACQHPGAPVDRPPWAPLAPRHHRNIKSNRPRCAASDCRTPSAAPPAAHTCRKMYIPLPTVLKSTANPGISAANPESPAAAPCARLFHYSQPCYGALARLGVLRLRRPPGRRNPHTLLKLDHTTCQCMTPW